MQRGAAEEGVLGRYGAVMCGARDKAALVCDRAVVLLLAHLTASAVAANEDPAALIDSYFSVSAEMWGCVGVGVGGVCSHMHGCSCRGLCLGRRAWWG